MRKRGKIWLVELGPTRGQEIKKTRPAVVISSALFSSIAIRIIIPIAKWQPKFPNRPFMLPIPRSKDNGLDSDSAGNVLQVRSISSERFVSCLGRVSKTITKELLAVLVTCVDYDVEP